MRLIGLMLVLVFASACNKDNNPPTPEPEMGDIIGTVSLYDEGVVSIENSGMKVYIEGDMEKSSTTNSDGKFSIKDLALGTYTVVFEKDGFGTFKKKDVKLEKNGDFASVNKSLGQKTITKVTSLTANVAGDDVSVEYATDPKGNSGSSRVIRYFFSNATGVSNENYTHYTINYEIKESPHSKTFTKSELIEMGFSSGETVYVRVYGDSYWSNEYEDKDAKTVFPNTNPSAHAEASFMMP